MESNRLTIVVGDGAVYRDEQTFINLDLSSCNIPNGIHALQWINGSGFIEFIDPVPNENIYTLPSWALSCVDIWEQAYTNYQNELQLIELQQIELQKHMDSLSEQ